MAINGCSWCGNDPTYPTKTECPNCGSPRTFCLGWFLCPVCDDGVERHVRTILMGLTKSPQLDQRGAAQ